MSIFKGKVKRAAAAVLSALTLIGAIPTGAFAAGSTANITFAYMFAGLIKYADQSYYDAHPVMYLTTEDATYKLELFSGYVTDTGSGAYTINCGTRHEFAQWLREISGKSDFKPNAISISTDDHIVTLSTCAYEFQNARYVVHGRLMKLED